MKSTRLRQTALLLTMIALLGTTTPTTHPVRAVGSSVSVSLGADSTSTTDTTIVPSASQAKSFRIGAILNASSTDLVSGIYGWQFSINYNASAFVPLGDPAQSSPYPDGAAHTVLFGSQTTTGTVNWAGLISAQRAYAGFQIIGPGEGGPDTLSPGRVYVYLTLLWPSPAVTISAKTFLANVNFELIDRPAGPQDFTVTDVKFVDSTSHLIPVVTSGQGAVETVTTSPPRAQFTITSAPSIGPYAFTFNGTTSSDVDSAIPNPGGYFWDFGDGTQDLGLAGSVVTHDYGVDGRFIASLRVVNTQGATGSARDSLGNLIRNFQPSHAYKHTGSEPDLPPVIVLLHSSNAAGLFTTFGTDGTYDPDGVIIFWYWSFGDGSQASLTRPDVQHIYTNPGTYNVTLRVVDDGNASSYASISIYVPFIFTFYPVEPSIGEFVSFSAQSNWGVTYLWDFGDGSTASSSQAWHEYNSPGNYTVTLTVDNQGFTTNPSKNIQVISPDLTRPHIEWTRLGTNYRGYFPSVLSVGPAAVYWAHGYELRSYDFQGNLLWTRQIGDSPIGMEIGSSGIYTVGSNLLKKYDLQGNLNWTRNIIVAGVSGYGSAVAVGSTAVYVAGALGNYSFLAKYDLSGSQLWTEKIENPRCTSPADLYSSCLPVEAATSVSLGKEGVYVVGYDSCYHTQRRRVSCSFDFYLRASDFDGNEIWTRNVTSWTSPYYFRSGLASTVASDRTGIYVTTAPDQQVRKFDFQGEEVWASGLAGNPVGMSAGLGGVFIAELSCSGCWTVTSSVESFDSNGNKVWALQLFTGNFDNGNFDYSSVSVSSNGIFVSGSFFISRISGPDPPNHHKHQR